MPWPPYSHRGNEKLRTFGHLRWCHGQCLSMSRWFSLNPTGTSHHPSLRGKGGQRNLHRNAMKCSKRAMNMAVAAIFRKFTWKPMETPRMHYVGYAELAAAVSNAGGLGTDNLQFPNWLFQLHPELRNKISWFYKIYVNTTFWTSTLRQMSDVLYIYIIWSNLQTKTAVIISLGRIITALTVAQPPRGKEALRDEIRCPAWSRICQAWTCQHLGRFRPFLRV